MPSWEEDGKQHACVFSLPVCCFCGPHPDWRALSNNMAGRQYESLVKFCPLKWYSITFWWASFCSKPRLIMIQNSRAIHFGTSRLLKPDQNNGFDTSCLSSTGNDINRRWWYIENLKAFFFIFWEILAKKRHLGLQLQEFLVESSWERHCFTVQVLCILHASLTACLSQTDK